MVSLWIMPFCFWAKPIWQTIPSLKFGALGWLLTQNKPFTVDNLVKATYFVRNVQNSLSLRISLPLPLAGDRERPRRQRRRRPCRSWGFHPSQAQRIARLGVESIPSRAILRKRLTYGTESDRRRPIRLRLGRSDSDSDESEPDRPRFRTLLHGHKNEYRRNENAEMDEWHWQYIKR